MTVSSPNHLLRPAKSAGRCARPLQSQVKSAFVRVSLCALAACFLPYPLSHGALRITLQLGLLHRLPKPVGESRGRHGERHCRHLRIARRLGVMIGVPVGVMGGSLSRGIRRSKTSTGGSGFVRSAERRTVDYLGHGRLWVDCAAHEKLLGLGGRRGAGFHHDPAGHAHHGRSPRAGAAQLPRSRARLGVAAMENDRADRAATAMRRDYHRSLTRGWAAWPARLLRCCSPRLATANWNHQLGDPIAALPLQIFTYAISPYDDWHRQAWAGALVLVAMTFCLSMGVRLFSPGRFQKNT